MGVGLGKLSPSGNDEAQRIKVFMSDPNAGKVVTFTNLSDSDFTHSFSGTPYFVPAGATLQFPYHLGKHLATHLSRKMLISQDKGATQYDPKDATSANGNGTVLWNEETEGKLVDRILGEVYTHEIEKPKTELELLKEKVAELNKFNQEFLKGNNMPSEGSEKPVDESFKDKGEIIAELKKKGLTVDARKSKASLEAQLKESEKTPA